MESNFETISKESQIKNEHNDCAVRAVAIACDYEYDDVHYLFNICGRKDRHTTPWPITRKVISLLRYQLLDATDNFTSRSIRSLEREMRLSCGRYIVRVRKHVLPIVNGKVHDWSKGRCHRILAIYELKETDPEFHKNNLQ